MDRFDIIMQRLTVGVQNFARALPKIMDDPRAYPREAMLLAAIVALTTLLLILFMMVLFDLFKELKARRQLRIRVRYTRRVQIAGFIVGLLGLLLLYGALTPMVPYGARVCDRCHTVQPQVKTWKEGSHSGVGCFGCHSSGGVTGAMEASVRGVSRVITRDHPRRATVDNSMCLRCHDAIGETFVGAGIRIRHEEIIKTGMDCLLCHEGTGHASANRDEYVEPLRGTTIIRSTMTRCLGCHDGEKASSDCLTCHLSGPLDPMKTDIAQGRTVSFTTCSGCHTKKLDKKCTDCHGLEMPHPGDFMRRHAGMSYKTPQLCARCHETASGVTGCSCHSDFVDAHGTFDDWFPQHGPGAKLTGRGGCNCHDISFCMFCHDTAPY